MELNVTVSEIPTVTRQGKPNPFAAHFPSDDKALNVTIPGDDTSKECQALIRQARLAANAVDRSARILTTVEGNGKGQKTVLQVWTVAKISRPRKTAE